MCSSGTSGGERKLMPTVPEEIGKRFQLSSLVIPVISQFVPDLEKRKGMYFWSIKSEAKTPGGLPARPVLTNSYQNMYSQMLCGLYQRKEVLRVGSYFASGLICAIRFLEKHWSLLCNDIRMGTLNTQITDQSVRESVMKILKPDPELADSIEAECSRDSWQGIIARLWPNTKYVDVVVTGSMSQYIPTLDYYSNSLPLVSTTYGSSECFFGINLNPFIKPSEVSYTLIPTMCYFEFAPIHRDNGVINSISKSKSLNEKEQNQLVDLVDVKIGKEYELIQGGDVLRVAGYKNNAPQFYFVCWENVI
ncbi:hypothetical protein RDI58_023779 [Solanum bulbocastanum]|uniref:GH3 middle domain-containing protein n=1 Tax=Solanum bulbocastanum TaxID=147425 RepID=A0AAN8T1T4_SOLBU